MMPLPGPTCEIGAYTFSVITTTRRGPGLPDSFTVECTHRPTGVVWKVTHLLVFPVLPPPGLPPPPPQQLVAGPPLERVNQFPPSLYHEGPPRTPPVAGGVIVGEVAEPKRLALTPKWPPPPPPLLPQPPPPKWPAEPPLPPKDKERKRSRSRRRRGSASTSISAKEQPPKKAAPRELVKHNKQ